MTESNDDLKIGIIGGGPAGSFACHFLNKLAKKAGKKITIHIYDYKSFSCVGKSSCNMCAGIISYSLVTKLEDENIFLPESVIKSEISGYQLHSKYNTVYFKKYGKKKIYSVFRGQGPLRLDGKVNSFDQFLLDFVSKESNVSIFKKKVTGIDFFSPGGVEVKTEDSSTAVYDFVIGAFGVNTKIKDIIKTGYKPPKTYNFFQFEMQLPEDFITRTYKGRVHMFPVYKNHTWFITLTPKWNFITVTAVGKDVQFEDVKSEILENKNIRHYLPSKDLELKCGCRPQVPVNFSKKPYGKRFLMVGDACVSRYLKNGIESAYLTAYLAADTIINHGLTEKILKRKYHKRCKKEYRLDNICGKLLYLLDRVLFHFPFYSESRMIGAKKEQITRKSTMYSEVLWDMFTGDRKYKEVLKSVFHPHLVYTTAKEFLVVAMTAIFKGMGAINYPISKFYKLLNTHTVAVIGGGPAGSSFAIKLARLSKEINLDLNIVLFEGKDFYRHHNQCVGILSPPLPEILKTELGLELPQSLIKSDVPGYELHTGKESIFLEDYHPDAAAHKTFSVRRSELDNFLLNKAKEQGVKVISSRVTDIEFCRDVYHDEVRIFSDSMYLKADVVVCAFGLDSEMMEKLTEATKGKYRRPGKIMKTFVTRIDFPRNLLDKQYDKRIYPFLISTLKNVEFGAVTIKDDHIVVNVAGMKITSSNLNEFLSLQEVVNILPTGITDSLNWYSGKFPSSPAKNPYGDRYVTIGDTTGWLRPIKGKGINLAVITGINAAKVMINEGFSKKAFDKYREANKEFIQDYKYGALVRMGLRTMLKTGIIDLVIRLAKKHNRFYELLYDSVSAERSYKNIFLRLFKRRGQKN